MSSSSYSDVRTMFSCSVCTAPQSRYYAYVHSGVRGFYRCPYCKSYLQVSGRVTPAIFAAIVALGFVGLNWMVPVYPGSNLFWIAFQVVTVIAVYFGLLAWLLSVERRQPMRKFML